MNISTSRFFLFFIISQLIFPRVDASAKDIDLDGIYIKKESTLYRQLADAKIDAHLAVKSLYIDKDVIFSEWISGNEILYIRELNESNILYIYNQWEHVKNEILRIPGTITSILLSADGRYLFLKRLLITDENLPRGETLTLNLRTARLLVEKSPHFFMNLTLAPGGNTIFYEDDDGIVEFNPDLNVKSLVYPSHTYSDIVSSKYNTLAYISPNRQKTLFINGSGGLYNAKVLSKEGGVIIKGLSSSTEICWLNNNRLAYRLGFSGNYSIIIHDIRKGTSANIMNNSLNTNLHYSPHAGILTFLKNQIIHFYRTHDNAIINIGIEGEDIFFSPDGNRFISLLYKKLFLTQVNYIEKRNIMLKNNSKIILGLYRSLMRRNDFWANEYSYSYIIRKIDDYRFLAGE